MHWFYKHNTIFPREKKKIMRKKRHISRRNDDDDDDNDDDDEFDRLSVNGRIQQERNVKHFTLQQQGSSRLDLESEHHIS